MFRTIISLRVRRLALLAATVLALFAGAILALAFAEEPLTFRDPYSGELTDEEVSTIHNDLTYVLALAAGFSVSDSIALQIWNQLVDSEALGPGDAISYTNGGGAFYPPPDPDVVCGGKAHTKVLWPRAGDIVISTSVTTRFGVYSPFFHFPRRNPGRDRRAARLGLGSDRQVGRLRGVCLGRAGRLTVMRRKLSLHPVGGDHRRRWRPVRWRPSPPICTPWPIPILIWIASRRWTRWAGPGPRTRRRRSITSVPACDYHPRTPKAGDVHGREFYTYTDSLRTDAAVRAVYAELLAQQRGPRGALPANRAG